MSFFVRGWPAPAASLRPRRPHPLWAVALWLGAAVALLPRYSALAADFTPDQRKAIESIIREYLTKNPEVMLDALEAGRPVTVRLAFICRWLPEHADRLPAWPRTVPHVRVCADDLVRHATAR